MFYEWIILQLDAYPQFEGKTDVVFVVHWQRVANNGNGLTAQIYGAQQIKISTDDPFTPYDQLTQSQVVRWVKNALGEETLLKQEKYLQQQIKDQISPPVVSPPLPWGDDLTPHQDFYIDNYPVDPVPVDPAPVDPVPVDPYPVDPYPVDPAPVDPVPVDPYPVDPYPVDPVPVDPAPVDPAPVDPAPVDPYPVDPYPVDPAPVDPYPVDPAPVDPAPVDPIIVLSE